MHVSGIRLKNWRGLKELTLEGLPRITFLTGHNGGGKSSILGAVQFTLTGSCHDQEGKSIRLPDLVGPHGKSARVALDLTSERGTVTLEMRADGNSSSVRILTSDGKVWMQGRPAEVREQFWKKLGLEVRHAAVSLNPWAHLLSDELSRLLAALGGDLDTERLREWCGPHYDFLNGFLAEQNLSLTDVTHMEAIGKAAYTARTIHNRELKRLTQELEELANLEIPTDQAGNPIQSTALASVRRHLEALQKERDALLRRAGQAETYRSREEIDADMKRVQAEIKALSAKRPQESDLEAAREALKTAEQRHNGLAAEIDNLLGRIKVQKSLLARLTNDDEPVCPTCKRPYGDDDVQNILEPIKKDITAMEQDIGHKKAERQEALEVIEPTRKGLSALNEQERSIGSKIANLEQQLAFLKTEEPAFDVTETESAIKEIEGRIATGQRILDDVEKLQARDGLALQRQQAYATVEHLDWAVDAFRDGAAQNDLCRAGRAEFVAATNARLEPHGFRLDVVSEGSKFLVLLARQDSGTFVPARMCSDGELLLAQMAVAEAFAGQTGLGILDCLDGLDGRHKPVLFDNLHNTQAGWLLAGAWGLGTLPDPSAIAELFAPAAVVWVDGENTERMQ